MISTVYSDLSEIVSGDEREKYQNESIDYAQKELKLRLENGETKGFGLMNSYHTLGVAQSELAGEDVLMYKKAKNNLELAKDLAEKEGMNMVPSVLKLKLAWAEFRKYPEKKPGEHYEKIGTYFHEVLDDQKTPAKWNPAIKDKLKEKMFTLGNYLGKGPLIMLEKMYKN